MISPWALPVVPQTANQTFEIAVPTIGDTVLKSSPRATNPSAHLVQRD